MVVRVQAGGLRVLLGGSWDLVTRVTIRVAILITTYNPKKVLIALLTKSHDPPSRVHGVRWRDESVVV